MFYANSGAAHCTSQERADAGTCNSRLLGTPLIFVEAQGLTSMLDQSDSFKIRLPVPVLDRVRASAHLCS